MQFPRNSSGVKQRPKTTSTSYETKTQKNLKPAKLTKSRNFIERSKFISDTKLLCNFIISFDISHLRASAVLKKLKINGNVNKICRMLMSLPMLIFLLRNFLKRVKFMS